ncbi:MAG: hypothetical protein WED04_08595 [Promethearchaeati archaeon SRVP18_Atabeyarchaeia-1]
MSTKAQKKGSGAEDRRIAFLLALIGGACLILAGVSGGVWIYAQAFAAIVLVYPELAGILGLILPILTAIASLGGIAVIIGGVLILGVRLTTGKFLIMMGAGVGILGIFIGLASGLAQGWGLVQSAQAVFATYQVIGWIGILFAILARFMARK